MKPRVLIYALCMLITGSINTISTKFQDMSIVGYKSGGAPIYFQHPAFQSACMFLGEALCLIPYFFLRWRRKVQKAQQGITMSSKPPMSRMFFLKRVLAFAVPTLCDAIATTLLNIGLFFTFASTYQMLRGTLVLFAGVLTIAILRRRLYLHHWLGMVLIMAGAIIVGATAAIYPPHEATPQCAPAAPPLPYPAFPLSTQADSPQPAARGLLSHRVWNTWTGLVKGGAETGPGAGLRGAGCEHVEGEGGPAEEHPILEGAAVVSSGSSAPVLGNVLVVLAQLFASLQFILEEKFLGQYRTQPLLAVGMEGMWGVVLCLGALPLLQNIEAPNGLPLDDALGAFKAIARVPSLRNAVILSIISIGVFNFFGLSVTKALSGASRATIDASRTVLVWLFALAAGWEAFHVMQLLGFLVLISGTSLYNELLRICLPPDDENGEEDATGVVPHGPRRRQRGLDWEATWSKHRPRDVEAGGPSREASNQLLDPLLGSPGPDQTKPGVPKTIQGGRSGAHPQHHHRHAQHMHHHNMMARSMRLGYRTLSPRDLGDDEGDSVDSGSLQQSADALDPMALVSTPAWSYMQSNHQYRRPLREGGLGYSSQQLASRPEGGTSRDGNRGGDGNESESESESGSASGSGSGNGSGDEEGSLSSSSSRGGEQGTGDGDSGFLIPGTAEGELGSSQARLQRQREREQTQREEPQK